MKLFLFRDLRSCLTGLCVLLVGLALNFNAVAAPASIKVTDTNGRSLPDAVVYLVPENTSELIASPGQSTEMVQRDTTFNPAVMAIQTGTSVSFPNEDPFRHHVYSFSEAKSFELRLYGRRETPSVLFDQPGHVALGCNIHDNMLGHIYVVSTPYFAVSDTQGLVTIADVPEGTYQLMAWHPDMRNASDEVTKTVQVGSSGLTDSVEIRVRRSRRQEDDFERFDY